MPNYGTGVIATPAAAAGAAYATFHTLGTRRARIYKIIVTATQTITSQVGIIRSSNTPVASTSVTPQPYDAADAPATALLDTAWSTPPTVGTNFLETFTLGPSIGAGITDVWQSDKEITLAVSTWLVFWNPGASAGAILSLTIQYDE
jgi:hypothetical protein